MLYINVYELSGLDMDVLHPMETTYDYVPSVGEFKKFLGKLIGAEDVKLYYKSIRTEFPRRNAENGDRIPECGQCELRSTAGKRWIEWSPWGLAYRHSRKEDVDKED